MYGPLFIKYFLKLCSFFKNSKFSMIAFDMCQATISLHEPSFSMQYSSGKVAAAELL